MISGCRFSKWLIAGVFAILLSSVFLFSDVLRHTPRLSSEIAIVAEQKTETLNIGVSKEYLLGKFDYRNDQRFVKISQKYADNPNVYLREEVYEPLKKMFAAAEGDGLSLKIISGARNFYEQKNIWEGKWSGRTGNYYLIDDKTEKAKAILRYSSMPGTSRHHWGTDLDLNSLDNEYFLRGEGKMIYEWLAVNAPEYGFCQPYTQMEESRPTGFQEEKWHWTYMPLAAEFLSSYLLLVEENDIGGFLGGEEVAKIDIINDYILGINGRCK